MSVELFSSQHSRDGSLEGTQRRYASAALATISTIGIYLETNMEIYKKKVFVMNDGAIAPPMNPPIYFFLFYLFYLASFSG